MAKQTRTTKKTTKKVAKRSSPATRKAATQARATVTPTEEQIRQRAYEIYLRRNGAAGDPHSDWVQAERELTEETSGR